MITSLQLIQAMIKCTHGVTWAWRCVNSPGIKCVLKIFRKLTAKKALKMRITNRSFIRSCMIKRVIDRGHCFYLVTVNCSKSKKAEENARKQYYRLLISISKIIPCCSDQQRSCRTVAKHDYILRCHIKIPLRFRSYILQAELKKNHRSCKVILPKLSCRVTSENEDISQEMLIHERIIVKFLKKYSWRDKYIFPDYFHKIAHKIDRISKHNLLINQIVPLVLVQSAPSCAICSGGSSWNRVTLADK